LLGIFQFVLILLLSTLAIVFGRYNIAPKWFEVNEIKIYDTISNIIKSELNFE